MIAWERLQTVFAVAALIPATVLAVRRPLHRPVAALVGVFLLEHPALTALRDRVIFPAQESMRAAGLDPFVAPLTGWDRVAGHAYQGLWMLWSPLIAASCACIFGQRRDIKLPAVLWAGALFLLIICYENFRGGSPASVYLLVHLVSVGLAIRSAARWFRWHRSPRAHHAAALACILYEIAGMLAYKAGLWGSAWDVARVASCFLFAVLFLIEGGALLWNMSSSSAR